MRQQTMVSQGNPQADGRKVNDEKSRQPEPTKGKRGNQQACVNKDVIQEKMRIKPLPSGIGG